MDGRGQMTKLGVQNAYLVGVNPVRVMKSSLMIGLPRNEGWTPSVVTGWMLAGPVARFAAGAPTVRIGASEAFSFFFFFISLLPNAAT